MQILPINLLSLNRKQLINFFIKINEKSYRVKQITSWIYKRNILSFNDMLDLSITLRTKLDKIATLKTLKIISCNTTKDGVINWVFALDDNNYIETVFIPEKNRGTICISSQVGCSLACTFCATSKQGFNRNLTTNEIISQILIVKKYIENINKFITNVVFMGMEEPLLNEKNVYNACSILLDDYFFGLSRRKVTISTAGVVPAILRMSTQTNVSLAVSLHASNNKLRNELVPINKKYPLEKLLNACNEYINAGSQKRHILFEYVMLSGINDSEKNAKELISLLKNISAKINLIPFNSFAGTSYCASNKKNIENFQNILHNSGIRVTTRRVRGLDSSAACGQLVGKVDNKKIKLC